MEWWTHFLDLLTQNVYFRAGFLWGLVVALIVWLIYVTLSWLYVEWLKIRTYFEPSKRPGKTPLETGPSPASITLGCMGRTLIVATVITAVILVSMWLTNAPGI
jgi:hypothetical protein